MTSPIQSDDVPRELFFIIFRVTGGYNLLYSFIQKQSPGKTGALNTSNT